jgi:lipoteichoic acid synthase
VPRSVARVTLCAVSAVLAALAIGCARPSIGPHRLDFSLDGRSPRLLETSQEIAVPLTVVNTGEREWDPARVHVSYHWLWLVPRETVARSRWNAPYHDGIRSTLNARVAPRVGVALQGRLLAPAIPGLYWLQWDMVEEGASWFGQVAPRQPRTLVLVVPPPAWLLAPLPLLVAIVGLVRLKPDTTGDKPDTTRRSPDVTNDTRPYVASGFSRTHIVSSRASIDADVVWCMAALFAKPLIVFHDALLEPTAVAYWLVAVTAIVPPLAAWVVLPRRARAWVLVGVGLVASALILGDVVYYRFFGDILSAPALLGAHQTGHVVGSIRSLLTPGLLWLIADWPFAIWIALRVSRAHVSSAPVGQRAKASVVVLIATALVGVLISAPRVLASTPVDQMFRNRSIAEQLGPLGYHAYDFWNYARATWLRPPVSDAQIAQARDWFASRADLRAGPGHPAFAAARGRNVIVVQVESLQDFVVDYRVDGQDVMPHLRAWADDSLRFTNVTDQTNEGRTSDAEFTTLTSLLPLDHGAVAFRFPGNHYVALPRVLSEHGYATLSAVPFESGFWNRQVLHPSYGFQKSLFEPDFQMTEQIGWGLNDHDFLQQMVPRLEQMPRPFVAWTITLSLHHPFESFPDAHKELKLGALEGSSFGNYLHTMRFFDNALEAFKTSLARDGLLDDSVVVVFGDHDAGFSRDRELADRIGIGADEASWTLNDRVPLFIRVPHPRDPPDPLGLSGERREPAGQTDLAPTLLALLGVDAAPLPYAGRNLLGAATGPVIRPYGSWLDRQHLFLLAGGAAGLCYDVGDGHAASADRCQESDVEARRARAMSRLVVVDDLQQRLRR